MPYDYFLIKEHTEQLKSRDATIKSKEASLVNLRDRLSAEKIDSTKLQLSLNRKIQKLQDDLTKEKERANVFEALNLDLTSRLSSKAASVKECEEKIRCLQVVAKKQRSKIIRLTQDRQRAKARAARELIAERLQLSKKIVELSEAHVGKKVRKLQIYWNSLDRDKLCLILSGTQLL